MPMSISGSNLQQSNPHILRKHAGASKALQEQSAASTETVASTQGIGNRIRIGTSSALTSFLAQLSSLDGKGDERAPAGSAVAPPAAASSAIEQMMQTLQVIGAAKGPV